MSSSHAARFVLFASDGCIQGAYWIIPSSGCLPVLGGIYTNLFLSDLSWLCHLGGVTFFNNMEHDNITQVTVTVSKVLLAMYAECKAIIAKSFLWKTEGI